MQSIYTFHFPRYNDLVDLTADVPESVSPVIFTGGSKMENYVSSAFTVSTIGHFLRL